MNPFSRRPRIPGAWVHGTDSLVSVVSRSITHGREGEHIDFKEDGYESSPVGGGEGKRGNKRLSFLSDVAAFANAQGGLIVLGVSDNGPPFAIKGLSSAALDAAMKRLTDWQTRHLKPNCKFVSMQQASIDGKNILIVQIRPSQDGPVYYENEGSHFVFVRDKDRNRQARLDEIEKLLNSRPLPAAKKAARLLASEFERSLGLGGVVMGAFSSIHDSRFQEITKARLEYRTGYQLVASSWQIGIVREAVVTSYEDLHADESAWKLGMRVMLDDKYRPIGVRHPSYSVSAILLGDTQKHLDNFTSLSKRAGRMISRYGRDLLGQSPAWSEALRAASSGGLDGWLAILVHWQMKNGPGYEFLTTNVPYLRPGFAIDPIGTPFGVTFEDDLRVLSARVLEEMSMR
jgi:hypothetical protein